MRRVAVLLALIAGVLVGCVAPATEAGPDYDRLKAEAYATRHPFSRLVIEIDHAPGFSPSPDVIDRFVDTVASVVDKTDIEVRKFEELPRDDARFSGDREWTGQLRGLHAEYLSTIPYSPLTWGAGDTAVLHVFYLNGYLRGGDGGQIYGLATEEAVYLFMDTIRDGNTEAEGGGNRLPNVAAERVELAVLLHEFGHMVGLVNSGAPMVNDRDDGTGHSTNPESVMRSGVAGPYAVLDEPLGMHNAPIEFDADDREDLRALIDETNALAGNRAI